VDYLITFFTHFGAVKLCRQLEREGIPNAMMPVPRSVSSDCGTCVRLVGDGDPTRFFTDDAEAVYQVEKGRYILLLHRS